MEKKVIIQSNGTVTVTLRGKVVCMDKQLREGHVCDFLNHVGNLVPCPGVTDPSLTEMASSKEQAFQKSISWHGDTRHEQVHSVHCTGLRGCQPCQNVLRALQARLRRMLQKPKKAIHRNAPLTKLPVQNLINEIKRQRAETREKDRQISRIQNQIATDGIVITESLHKGMQSVLDSNDFSDDLARLFWEEQKKNFSRSPKSRRWHPMMIRLALLVHSRSPAAYETLKKTGVLVLPSGSTLRDYTNYLAPGEGFKPEVNKGEIIC